MLYVCIGRGGIEYLCSFLHLLLSRVDVSLIARSLHRPYVQVDLYGVLAVHKSKAYTSYGINMKLPTLLDMPDSHIHLLSHDALPVVAVLSISTYRFQLQ